MLAESGKGVVVLAVHICMRCGSCLDALKYRIES